MDKELCNAIRFAFVLHSFFGVCEFKNELRYKAVDKVIPFLPPGPGCDREAGAHQWRAPFVTRDETKRKHSPIMLLID